MKIALASLASAVLLTAGGATAVAVSEGGTEVTATACATASAPGHTVAVDGGDVYVIPPVTDTRCATATATQPPSSTVTVTATTATTSGPTVTTSPTTTQPTGCNSTVTTAQGLQSALSSAPPGSVTCVQPGLYLGAFTYSRAPSSTVTVLCQGDAVLRNPSGYTLRIQPGSARLRVEGCVFDGSGVAAGGQIDSYGSLIEIVDNEVRNSNDNGIYLAEESRSHVISGNWIHDNGVNDSSQDHGIYLQGNDHLVEGNLIENHPQGFGVQVYDNGQRIRLVGNTIRGSGLVRRCCGGVVVGGGSGGDVRNVELFDNTITGSYGGDVSNDRLDGTCGPWPTGTAIHGNRTQKAITGFPSGCVFGNSLIP